MPINWPIILPIKWQNNSLSSLPKLARWCQGHPAIWFTFVRWEKLSLNPLQQQIGTDNNFVEHWPDMLSELDQISSSIKAEMFLKLSTSTKVFLRTFQHCISAFPEKRCIHVENRLACFRFWVCFPEVCAGSFWGSNCQLLVFEKSTSKDRRKLDDALPSLTIGYLMLDDSLGFPYYRLFNIWRYPSFPYLKIKKFRDSLTWK